MWGDNKKKQKQSREQELSHIYEMIGGDRSPDYAKVDKKNKQKRCCGSCQRPIVRFLKKHWARINTCMTLTVSVAFIVLACYLLSTMLVSTVSESHNKSGTRHVAVNESIVRYHVKPTVSAQVAAAPYLARKGKNTTIEITSPKLSSSAEKSGGSAIVVTGGISDGATSSTTTTTEKVSLKTDKVSPYDDAENMNVEAIIMNVGGIGATRNVKDTIVVHNDDTSEVIETSLDNNRVIDIRKKKLDESLLLPRTERPTTTMRRTTPPPTTTTTTTPMTIKPLIDTATTTRRSAFAVKPTIKIVLQKVEDTVTTTYDYTNDSDEDDDFKDKIEETLKGKTPTPLSRSKLSHKTEFSYSGTYTNACVRIKNRTMSVMLKTPYRRWARLSAPIDRKWPHKAEQFKAEMIARAHSEKIQDLAVYLFTVNKTKSYLGAEKPVKKMHIFVRSPKIIEWISLNMLVTTETKDSKKSDYCGEVEDYQRSNDIRPGYTEDYSKISPAVLQQKLMNETQDFLQAEKEILPVVSLTTKAPSVSITPSVLK